MYLSDIFHYASNNDIKSLNRSINDIGRIHHANYMANMMFSNDINQNSYMLLSIQSTLELLYNTIQKNYSLKKEASDAIKSLYKETSFSYHAFSLLTEYQFHEMVYHQALNYYFGIQVTNNFSSETFLESALQYRITSSFMCNEIGCITEKVVEDIEVISIDSENLTFLLKNYRKLSQSPNSQRYKFITKLISENINNIILRDDGFDKSFFTSVQYMSDVIKKYFT